MANSYEDLKEGMEDVISKIPDPVDQDILRRRFGLEDGRSQTLAEVAEAKGITAEDVQDRERVALEYIRKNKLVAMPEAQEGDATSLLRQALNLDKDTGAN